MVVHICVWRLWLKSFSSSSVQFLKWVCLHPVLSCAYASCTLCLSSFHHVDYACILLCLLLSTYFAASSSSLRNFLTGKFLSEEFHKSRLFTPLVDITHFQLVSEQGTPLSVWFWFNRHEIWDGIHVRGIRTLMVVLLSTKLDLSQKVFDKFKVLTTMRFSHSYQCLSLSESC